MFPCRLVRFASAQAHLYGSCLGDLVADPEVGIKGRARVLKDHGDLGSAHPFHRLVVEVEQVDAVQHDFAADNPPRRRHQAKDGKPGRGLAGPGLAHQAKGLAAGDIEIDAVDRPHRVRRELEMGCQAAHAQHGRGSTAHAIAIDWRAHRSCTASGSGHRHGLSVRIR